VSQSYDSSLTGSQVLSPEGLACDIVPSSQVSAKPLRKRKKRGKRKGGSSKRRKVDVGQTDEANSDDDFLKPEVTFKQKETAFTGTSGDRPEMKFGNESVVGLSEVNRSDENGCQCYKLLFFTTSLTAEQNMRECLSLKSYFKLV
jgi:hypothetical protein